MLSIASLTSLEEHLSRPDAAVLQTLHRTPGDFLVAGAGGKMGPSVCRMLRRGLNAIGRDSSEVYAVSRFSVPEYSASLRLAQPQRLGQSPGRPQRDLHGRPEIRYDGCARADLGDEHSFACTGRRAFPLLEHGRVFHRLRLSPDTSVRVRFSGG